MRFVQRGWAKKEIADLAGLCGTLLRLPDDSRPCTKSCERSACHRRSIGWFVIVFVVGTSRTIATQTNGHYEFDGVSDHARRPLLVGFHGYGELATDQFERLSAVRGEQPWNIVSIQALHRFYRSGGQRTAASWMTRDHRELAISDNIAYIDRVLGVLDDEWGRPTAVVFAGFSQGASMAYRAAALGTRTSAGVIACGGDIPPELSDEQLRRIPAVLVGWGEHDNFFTASARDADLARLRRAGVSVTVAAFDIGHEWTERFSAAASEWMSGVV